MPKKKNPLMLKINENYIPAFKEPGKEYYSNGIFVFNITKMLDYIRRCLLFIYINI
jgi:hypothetical protein